MEIKNCDIDLYSRAVSSNEKKYGVVAWKQEDNILLEQLITNIRNDYLHTS